MYKNIDKKLIELESLLKFKTMGKDEIMIIQFDTNEVDLELLCDFVKVWKNNGFTNFVMCPTNVEIRDKHDSILFMEREIELLKNKVKD